MTAKARVEGWTSPTSALSTGERHPPTVHKYYTRKLLFFFKKNRQNTHRAPTSISNDSTFLMMGCRVGVERPAHCHLTAICTNAPPCPYEPTCWYQNKCNLTTATNTAIIRLRLRSQNMHHSKPSHIVKPHRHRLQLRPRHLDGSVPPMRLAPAFLLG